MLRALTKFSTGSRAGRRRQDVEFVAVLAQHRVARVDDVERRVAVQHLGQHARFLFVAAVSFRRVQEAAHARRSVQPFAGRLQPLQVFQQRDAVFHAGRVEPFQRVAALDAQARAFDVARGAGAVGDFAEARVARQRAQQARSCRCWCVPPRRCGSENQPCPVSSQSSALAEAASTACAGRPSAASCARQRRARRTILVRGQQQPDARLLRVRGQFGDQRERARSGVWRASQAIRRREAAASASASRMRRRSSRVSSRPAIWMPAGVVAGGQGRSLGSSSASSTGPSSPAGAGADRRGSCSGSTGGPGRWRPRRVPAGRAAAWPGSAGSMRRPASLRRSTTRHSSAAASRAARHRPPPRRSATATIAPGRRPARSGRRRWRAPWRRRAAGSPPRPAASRSPGSARRRCPARAAWWPR